jgi:hypothetical protein
VEETEMRNPKSYEGCSIDENGDVTDLAFHAEVFEDCTEEEKPWLRLWMAARGIKPETINAILGPEPETLVETPA